jgi:hypothetical protein
MRKPDFIFSIITALNSNVSIQTFINNLGKHWKDTEILLSGNQIINRKDLKIPENVNVLNSPMALFDFLDQLKDNLKYKKTIQNFSSKK